MAFRQSAHMPDLFEFPIRFPHSVHVRIVPRFSESVTLGCIASAGRGTRSPLILRYRQDVQGIVSHEWIRDDVRRR
jgi:hypothetical protein